MEEKEKTMQLVFEDRMSLPDASAHATTMGMQQFLRDMFLPANYPHSVSPDYTRYQIFNALQAFCSSLAGLISARALLEGFGVGDASASATTAMLLGVAQDVCGRLTTIFGAYFLGTSLFPEAKTYRFLADLLNDIAIVLDVLSPLFGSLNKHPSLPSGAGTCIRITALCTSASCRALCGMAAGGSKAAITLHFARGGVDGKGDIGDLNAKDGSKETVLALLGVLCGTAIVPYLTTTSLTYSALAVLLALHLTFNYLAVRGLTLRTLNRQRASLLWEAFSATPITDCLLIDQAIPGIGLAEIAERERILSFSGIIPHSSRSRCTIVNSAAQLISCCGIPVSRRNGKLIVRDKDIQQLADIFDNDKYVLWVPRNRYASFGQLYLTVKPGCSTQDLLKGWLLAQAVSHVVGPNEGNLSQTMKDARDTVHRAWPEFISGLRKVGWDVAGGLNVPGKPEPVVMYMIEHPSGDVTESRKTQ